ADRGRGGGTSSSATPSASSREPSGLAATPPTLGRVRSGVNFDAWSIATGRPLAGEGVRRAEDAAIGDDRGDEAGGRHVEGRVPGGRRGRDEAAARPPLGLARVALLGGDGRAPPGRRGGGREGGRGVVGEALG